MSVLGKIRIKKFLDDKNGVVTGKVVTDGNFVPIEMNMLIRI